MADGMYDSGGSGGGSSSSYVWIDRGGGSRDPGDPVASLIAALIVVAVLIAFVVAKQYALGEERELDATVYVETSNANFDRWLATRRYEIVPGSLAFEPGSSWRDSYHCKGGQFQTVAGETVTVCCSVEPNATPACVVITP